MPTWTKEDLRAYEQRRAGNKRAGTGASLQKFENVDAGEDHHVTKKSEMDEAGHPTYRISIVAHLSDNRRRDLDGINSTLLDVLVRSVRRFGKLGVHADNKSREVR